jgi:hypothetical protein
MMKTIVVWMVMLGAALAQQPAPRQEGPPFSPVGDVRLPGRVFQGAEARRSGDSSIEIKVREGDKPFHIPWSTAPAELRAKLGDETAKPTEFAADSRLGATELELNKRYGRAQANAVPKPPSKKAVIYRTEAINIEAHFLGEKADAKAQMLLVSKRTNAAFDDPEVKAILDQCGGGWERAMRWTEYGWARADGSFAMLIKDRKILRIEAAGFSAPPPAAGAKPGVKF